MAQPRMTWRKRVSTRSIKTRASPKGLTSAEAKARIDKYGRNELVAKETSDLEKFLLFFWGPIAWMIEAAAILSLLMGHWADLTIILVLLFYNAISGFWQERKASDALAALKAGMAPKATALRDGEFAAIDAAEVVPGDVLRIKLGEVVPADVRFIDGDYISIDQAALTGESLPVSKKVGDEGYSGSIAKKGEMNAVVIGTGNNTFFGRTASLVASAGGGASHSQQATAQIGDFLIITSVILCVLLVGFELYQDIVRAKRLAVVRAGGHRPHGAGAADRLHSGGHADGDHDHQFPGRPGPGEEEGHRLPARGHRGAGRGRHPVLGQDRDAHQEHPQPRRSDPVPAQSADELILAGALASEKGSEDAIDKAVSGGLKDPKALDGYKVTKFVPFDPVGKRTEGQVTNAQGKALRYTKGAPQVIIALCKLDAETEAKANKTVADLAAVGMRALGIAESADEGKSWSFLGILSMLDPPRDDSKATIEQAKEHGLQVKMATGDDVAIGSQISGQLGMGTHLIAAADLFTKDMDMDHLPDRIEQCVETADGFGRVFPEHKYGIVKALQHRGHVVAMTGDGVNDAPALKQADCGIAVSGATDAARAAAALILTAPGLSTVIDAIDESRRIFERIINYILFRVAMTLDIMFVVVLATLFFGFSPLTPVMIILIALLDDVPIMTIAYDNTPLPKEPVRWHMRRLLFVSGFMGVMAVAQTFGLLLIGMEWLSNPEWQSWIKLTQDQVQTAVFLQIVAGGHLLLFVMRSRGSFFSPPWPAMPMFLAIVGTQIFAVLLCGFGWFVTALPWTVIGLVWLYMLAWMVVLDWVKLALYSRIRSGADRPHWYTRFLKGRHPAQAVAQAGTAAE